MRNSQPTLLILVPGFAKDENDTTCIPFLQSFIKTTNRLYPQLNVVIIALDYPFTIKEYHWFNNKVIPLDGLRYKKLLRPVKWWKLYQEIKSVYKKNAPAGILSFWCDETALVGHYFSKWNRLKHYCWLQGQDAKKGNRILQYFKPAPGEVIALSGFLKDELKKNYSIDASRIIPAAVSVEEFNNVKPAEKTIDIIGVGSLIPLKQYDIFVEVIAAVQKRFHSVKAGICGQGPEKERISAFIGTKQLAGNIELKGQLSHTEVLQQMMRSKILLHTSSYEGYGRVCLEALYAGCHVISFVSPEKNKIDHWHVVSGKEEMINKCIEVLQLGSDHFFPVIPRKMEDTVKQVMELYTIQQ
jgi:glycosyltransferase involved in cell wall biosynthesis